MASIALVGDCTTTTSLALAAAWPDLGAGRHRDLVVIEVDPTGGSLAAWLDAPISPSLSTIVTALHHETSTGASPAAMWRTVDTMIRRSSAGVRFVPAPFRSIEARRAVTQAEQSLLSLIASATDVVALLDAGSIDPHRPPPACRRADVTVVCHRLDASSAPAATVRLERLAEQVGALRDAGHQVAVAVIGSDPFPLDEIIDFAAPGARGWQLAVDPLAAAVLAGRSGVTSRRLARLPLLKSAARAAIDLDAMSLIASHSPHHQKEAVVR